MALRHSAARLLSRAGVTLDGYKPYDPRIKDERVFRRVFLWGSLGLGDAYVDGWWECDRLDEFFDRTLRSRLEHSVVRLGDWALAARDAFMNVQSVRRALHVAEHHYDLGNAFYTELLGASMGYSSGYYRAGASDLTEAQDAKFDLVCTKLGLAPGMRVLEIGCGWGTFAAHAAKRYGVSVHGVTVSKEQLAFAQERCAGLPVTFHFGDYRTLPRELSGTFDRVVSIEMIEAVGAKNLGAYMRVAADALKPGGQFLLQAIMGNGHPDVWLSTRIFPNGVLPSLVQLSEAFAGVFRLEHAESFGSDYDKTLMAWNERFVGRWKNISMLRDPNGARLYDDRFFRMWQYYLLVCAGAFRSGKIDVTQFRLTKQS